MRVPPVYPSQFPASLSPARSLGIGPEREKTTPTAPKFADVEEGASRQSHREPTQSGTPEQHKAADGGIFALVKRVAMEFLPVAPEPTPEFGQRAVAAYLANRHTDDAEYVQHTSTLDVFA